MPDVQLFDIERVIGWNLIGVIQHSPGIPPAVDELRLKGPAEKQKACCQQH
jgi:hypothetical protein